MHTFSAPMGDLYDFAIRHFLFVFNYVFYLFVNLPNN